MKWCPDVITSMGQRKISTGTLSQRKGRAPQPSITFSCQAGVVGGKGSSTPMTMQRWLHKADSTYSRARPKTNRGISKENCWYFRSFSFETVSVLIWLKKHCIVPFKYSFAPLFPVKMQCHIELCHLVNRLHSNLFLCPTNGVSVWPTLHTRMPQRSASSEWIDMWANERDQISLLIWRQHFPRKMMHQKLWNLQVQRNPFYLCLVSPRRLFSAQAHDLARLASLLGWQQKHWCGCWQWTFLKFASVGVGFVGRNLTEHLVTNDLASKVSTVVFGRARL